MFLLMNGARAASILFSIPPGLEPRQFTGMVYLLLVAFVHLWLGIAGLSRSAEVFVLLWAFSVITPVATVAHVQQVCVFQYPCSRDALRPLFESDDVARISAIVVVFSLAAVVAAVALVRGKGFARYFWLFLMLATTVAAIWMLLANAMIVQNGYSLYYDPWGLSVLWALFWPASCAVAFWAVTSNVNH